MTVRSPAASRRRGQGPPRRAVARRADESGFALIAVMILLMILLVLAVTAFGQSGVSRSGTSRATANAAADGAANAGLSAALYDVASGTFCFAIANAAVLPSGASPANAGADTYSASASYYSTYPASGSPLTCSGTTLNGTPRAAVVTATGQASLAGVTSRETITETLDITQPPESFVAFQGGSGSLNLADLTVVTPPTGPGSSAPAQLGEIYTNGPVSGSCNQAASVVAQGSWALGGNCTVGGSVFLSGGSLTSSGATIDGGVTVAGGNITVNHTTISGNALAGGSITLCPGGPSPTPPSGCSSLGPAGPTTVDGSATATGTIDIGGLNATASTQPCSAQADNGATVDGCVTPDEPNPVADTTGFAMQSSWTAPAATATNPWPAAGYTVDPANCSASAVAADIAGASGPTVVPVDCATDLTLSAAVTVPDNATVDIWAPCGLSLPAANVYSFPATGPAPPGSPPPASPAAQLGFIVPPSPSGTCSSGVNPNLTLGAANLFAKGMSSFFYAAGTFADAANTNLTGSVMATTLSLPDPLTITYSPYTVDPGGAAQATSSPPGLNFGYQAVAEQRYVSSF